MARKSPVISKTNSNKVHLQSKIRSNCILFSIFVYFQSIKLKIFWVKCILLNHEIVRLSRFSNLLKSSFYLRVSQIQNEFFVGKHFYQLIINRHGFHFYEFEILIRLCHNVRILIIFGQIG